MADVRHVITSGQSLSVGWDSEATTISTASEAANAKYADTDGTLDALQTPNGQRQRPDLSMGYRLAEAFPARTYAMSTHGSGGTAIGPLSKGGASGQFEAAIARVTALRSARLTAGDAYTAQAIHWIQGEQDQVGSTTREAYVDLLEELLADYRADIGAIVGSAQTFPLIASQFATTPYLGGAAKISLALLDAARTIDGIYLACPHYTFDYVSGTNVHLTGTGYYHLGEYHARAEAAVTDGAGWAPFAPVSFEAVGNTVVVTYDAPTPPLVFDTSTIAAQTDMGFSLTGTAAQIVDVDITGANEVTITCDQPVWEPAATLGYGIAYDDGLVGLGNLRDSETAVSEHDAAPLPNWALHSLDNLGLESDRPPTAFVARGAYLLLADGFHELTFADVGP